MNETQSAEWLAQCFHEPAVNAKPFDPIGWLSSELKIPAGCIRMENPLRKPIGDGIDEVTYRFTIDPREK